MERNRERILCFPVGRKDRTMNRMDVSFVALCVSCFFMLMAMMTIPMKCLPVTLLLAGGGILAGIIMFANLSD